MKEVVYVGRVHMPMRIDIPTHHLTADEKVESARQVAVLFEAQLAQVGELHSHEQTQYYFQGQRQICANCHHPVPCPTAVILDA